MLAYTLLRFAVGCILLYFGFLHIHKKYGLEYSHTLPGFMHRPFTTWCLGATELIIGGMFIIGLYTQIAALVVMLFSLTIIVFYKQCVSLHTQGKVFYVLLFAVSLSLFITGAGALALDLPI